VEIWKVKFTINKAILNMVSIDESAVDSSHRNRLALIVVSKRLFESTKAWLETLPEIGVLGPVGN
jgi:hypothetical protein